MRVIVTGASPGIGGSTIRNLAQIANQKNEKLQIAACEITLTDDLKSLADEVGRLGADIEVLTGDLSAQQTSFAPRQSPQPILGKTRTWYPIKTFF